MKATLCKVRGGLPLKHRSSYEKMLNSALKICGIDSWKGILQVILLPAEQMKDLNWQSLKHEGATDVITFDLNAQDSPLTQDDEVTAEIYVCPEVAHNYALEHNLTPSRELVLYAVHGMLHLTGQDDIQDADRLEMRRKEAIVIEQLEKIGCRLDGYID